MTRKRSNQWPSEPTKGLSDAGYGMKFITRNVANTISKSKTSAL